MDMRQIKIGPKLFSKEKAMYRDWVTAIARENLQNSVDAGASKIEITLEKDGGLTKVTVSDNGPGMDMATLENVYFVLGETTKTSPTSIGGFGVARMLTCFAQEKYTLRTRDILVDGCGAEWSPTTGLPHHRGVEVTAWLDAGERNVLEAFESYLRSCHIDATVTLNGVRWKEWTYKNKHERSLSFGEVYTNKSKTSGVYVRSNGVTMFAPYISAPFLVIIELDASRSRTILQAHRDGLLSQYQRELESFVGELNINKQSALRQKRSKSTTYKGTGTFASRRKAKPTGEQDADMIDALLRANDCETLDTKSRAYLEGEEDPNKRAQFLAALSVALADKGVELKAPEVVQTQGQLHSGGGVVEEADDVDLTFEMFDTIVVDDTNNARVRKVIESYYPQNWDLMGTQWRWNKARTERQYFRAGVEKYKLLVMWKAACEFAIRLLQDNLQRGPEYIAWGVGWCFSDEALAKHKRDGNISWLLVNPCKGDGTMRHGQDKVGLAKLVAEACHEVCHIAHGDHDEQFANLLNDLMEQAFLYKTEMLNFMKEAKESAVAKLESMSEMVAA